MASEPEKTDVQRFVVSCHFHVCVIAGFNHRYDNMLKKCQETSCFLAIPKADETAYKLHLVVIRPLAQSTCGGEVVGLLGGSPPPSVAKWKFFSQFRMLEVNTQYVSWCDSVFN